MNDPIIIIDGIHYAPITEVPPPSPVRIVILQRGWVAVGRFTQEGDQCTLTSASTIRRWGTTKGLGEIAKAGPTTDTVLDHVGVIRFHELTVVATLDCDESKWAL